MSKQKTHWCLTIPARMLANFTEEARALFLAAVGNREGIKLPYNESVDFTFIVGYLEGSDDNTKEPHYHCLMSNPAGKSSTKGRCVTTLKGNGMNCPTDIYIQELQSTLPAYKRYMFKSEPENEKSIVDVTLEDTIRALKDTGLIVTRDKFYAELLKYKGATWCTRNKSIIDTFSMNTALFDSNRIIKKEINTERIVQRGKNMIVCFYETIKKNVDSHGIVSDHPLFEDLNNEYISKAITLIALTPMLFSRSEDVDNVPAIYLWGQASSGKSFLFNSSKAYKLLATDAAGVGRFKLDGVESAILMDDIQNITIDNDNNVSTIRALALGGATRIKVHSDTKLIHAFVVCTSNSKPAFLDSAYPPMEANAWKRRFVILQMTKNNFVDFVASSGNEFDYHCMYEHIAVFYKGVYEDCIKHSNKFEIFEDYYKNCDKYLIHSNPVETVDLLDDSLDAQLVIAMEEGEKIEAEKRTHEEEPFEAQKKMKLV